jgi:hypothetical protein
VSETNNKKKDRSMLMSICVLGIGLVAGLFLTLENLTTQVNLIESVKEDANFIIYEGVIAECEDNRECIRIGGGSSIEKFK